MNNSLLSEGQSNLQIPAQNYLESAISSYLYINHKWEEGIDTRLSHWMLKIIPTVLDT